VPPLPPEEAVAAGNRGSGELVLQAEHDGEVIVAPAIAIQARVQGTEITAVEIEAEVVVYMPACTNDALKGEHGAAERTRAIDETNADVCANVRRDDVRQDAELTDVAGIKASPLRTETCGGVYLVLATNGLQLDARTDEFVSDHATGVYVVIGTLVNWVPAVLTVVFSSRLRPPPSAPI
jgi:hypothetical protein